MILKNRKRKGNPDYSSQLRELSKVKIDEWLDNSYKDKIRYAIAIEETDAWVLTIYNQSGKDTCTFNNPKKKLQFIIAEQKLTRKQLQNNEKVKPKELTVKDYKELSEKFRDPKQLKIYAKLNQSLDEFCTSLDGLV